MDIQGSLKRLRKTSSDFKSLQVPWRKIGETSILLPRVAQVLLDSQKNTFPWPLQEAIQWDFKCVSSYFKILEETWQNLKLLEGTWSFAWDQKQQEWLPTSSLDSSMTIEEFVQTIIQKELQVWSSSCPKVLQWPFKDHWRGIWRVIRTNTSSFVNFLSNGHWMSIQWSLKGRSDDRSKIHSSLS